MRSRNWLVTVVAATVCLLAIGKQRDAHAYAFHHCDNGKLPTWLWPPIHMNRNDCSIKVGGSAHNAYLNAISAWNESAHDAQLAHYGYFSDCHINHIDGWNEVALVNPEEIDGNLGWTEWYFFCDGNARYQEADVLIANNMTYHDPFTHGNEMPRTQSKPGCGRQAFVHEFGHVLGLADDNSVFGVMRNPMPWPLRGGYTEHMGVQPDDMLGVRARYGGWPTMNLGLSAQYLKSDGTLDEPPRVTEALYAGNPLWFNCTALNLGYHDVSVRFDFYLSTNPTSTSIAAGDLHLGYVDSVYIPSYRDLALEVQAIVPATLPFGVKYYRYILIDALDEVFENGGANDNILRERRRLRRLVRPQ